MLKLEKKYIITGEILLKTGLMVGGSSSSLEIGGTDKQIVRHPVTKIPYIPGSSIKGKMRSLLELSRGEISSDGKSFGPTHNPKHVSAQIFGHIKHKSGNDNKIQRPSRLIVRDAHMSDKSISELQNAQTDIPFTEIKAENSIDRITAVANPRFFERVPQGASFNLNMVLNILPKKIQIENTEHDLDSHSDVYLQRIFDALELLEQDYLGGGGSRGNGQVKIYLTSIEEITYNEDGTKTGKSYKIPKIFSNANETPASVEPQALND